MIKWLPKFEKTHILLLAAVVLGLGLRLYGIKWGLPDVLHPGYSYHPDEALHLDFARMLVKGDIVGKQFIYGGTFYYTILNAYYFFGGKFAELLGGVNHLANSILFGRYFHTAIAALTILTVYQCGRALFDKTTGALAAIILALMPAHIVCAQRMRPDEIGAFFPVLIMMLSWRIVTADKEKRVRCYVYAGLALGMAVAFRFPLAISVAAPIVAHVVVQGEKNARGVIRSLWDWRLVMMLGVAVLGYSVASPHTLIYPEGFMQGLKVQWWYQSGLFTDAVDGGPGAYQWGWTMLHEAVGYPLYFLALGGVALAFIRRSQADVAVLAVGVPYFILTTFTSWIVVRYTLPLLPLLAIFSGRFMAYVVTASPRYKVVAYVLFAVTLVWTMLADYAYLKMEAGKDVRDTASEWIVHNIPQGSSIAIVKNYLQDQFFNPVIPKGYPMAVFYLNEANDSRSFFQDNKFDYLILHEFIYKNVERLGPRHPYPHERIFYESLLNSHYKNIKEFKQPVEAMGIDFSSWFTSQDYVIANPAIRVYKHLN